MITLSQLNLILTAFVIIFQTIIELIKNVKEAN